MIYDTCVTGLDNPEFCEQIAVDATDMAQLIENSLPITKRQFEIISPIKVDEVSEFGFHIERRVVWAYNPTTDVHHFCGPINRLVISKKT